MSLKKARWIARAFVLLYFLVLCAGLKSAALTEDDDFYVPAGISYGEWVLKALRFEPVFNRAAIDQAFESNTLLDGHQIRGAFARCVGELKADLKSIAASGWGPSRCRPS